jgi:hypothetical protein
MSAKTPTVDLVATIRDSLPPDTEWDERERALLALDERQAADVDRLEADIAKRGVRVDGRGAQVLNQALAEARMGRVALARLLGQVDVPDAVAPAVLSPTEHRSRPGFCVRWRRRALRPALSDRPGGHGVAQSGARADHSHEARHVCASIFIAAGLNAKAVSVLMGHSSIDYLRHLRAPVRGLGGRGREAGRRLSQSSAGAGRGAGQSSGSGPGERLTGARAGASGRRRAWPSAARGPATAPKMGGLQALYSVRAITRRWISFVPS